MATNDDVTVQMLRSVGKRVRGHADAPDEGAAIDLLARVAAEIKSRREDVKKLEVEIFEAENKVADYDKLQDRFNLLVEKIEDHERGIITLAELLQMAQEGMVNAR